MPASWEFAEARRHVGLETPGLFEVEGRRHGGRRSGARGQSAADRSASRRPGAFAPPQRFERDLVPAGSQRGLAALRKAADDAARNEAATPA